VRLRRKPVGSGVFWSTQRIDSVTGGIPAGGVGEVSWPSFLWFTIHPLFQSSPDAAGRGVQAPEDVPEASVTFGSFNRRAVSLRGRSGTCNWDKRPQAASLSPPDALGNHRNIQRHRRHDP